jgi:Glycoside-hydrolase family GH114
MRMRVTHLGVAAVLLGLIAGSPARGATEAQRCAAAKLKAAGKATECLLGLDAKAAAGSTLDPVRVQRCRDQLGDPTRGTFARAEARGGCIITGDATGVQGQIDTVVSGINTALAVGTPTACQGAKLMAAGKNAKCLYALEAKGAISGFVDPDRVQACRDKMAAAFEKAEARGSCGTTGDAASIETTLDALVAAIVAGEPTTATCAIADCPAPVLCDTSAGACWTPSASERFQYQLEAALTPDQSCAFPTTGGIDAGITAVPFTGGVAVAPTVYDIDFLVDPLCAAGGSNDVDNTAVAALHAAGAHAVCYLDAGTDEPFRPDHALYVSFDQSCGGCLFGKAVRGFNEEHWLDLNDTQGQRTFILDRVAARLARCKAAGFDAVEFDNVDGYANDTGRPISEATQLLFNTALANLAHTNGLTAALKNDLEQIPELLPYFDMAVNEQCQEFDECGALDPFVAAGKSVFQVEYSVAPSAFCPQANGAGRIAAKKTVDLFDTPWTPCR